MLTFSEQRAQVLHLASEARALADSRADSAAVNDFDRATEEIARGRLSLAVVGEFKRGKSSLLNALIEEPGLFPVDTTIATRMVTSVTYGDPETITVFVDGEGRRPKAKPKLIERAQIADYVTEQGNPDNVRGARLLTIETPSPKLRDGLVVVDTPGVGGLNTEHTAATYGYVTNADIVLFVLDALTPLSTEELDFVKTVGEHAAEVLFVITKTDKVADYEVIVENTRAKVAKVLRRSQDDVVAIPVSSYAKLEYLKSRDPEDLEVSNFEELEAAVWGTLRVRGGAILLLRSLGSLARGLDNMARPITAELEAYEHRSQKSVSRAERKLAEASARSQTLLRREASWRGTLQRSIERARHEIINNRFKTRTLALRYELDRLLDDDSLLERPEELVGRVDRDLALLDSELIEAVQERADAVVARLSTETKLSLNPAAPDAPLALKAARPDFRFVLEDPGLTIEKIENVKRGWEVGSGLGATIGGLIASFIAATPIGALTIAAGAAIAGGAHVVRKQLRELKVKERDTRRDEIAERLKPYFDESAQQLEARLTEAFELTEAAIVESFDSRLSAEQARVEEAIAATEAARARSREQAALRMAELQQPLVRIKTLRATTEQLTRATLAGDQVGSPQLVTAAFDGG